MIDLYRHNTNYFLKLENIFIMCKEKECELYGQYANWLNSKKHKESTDIVGALESLAAINDTKVHKIIDHKQCHQPTEHLVVRQRRPESWE